MSDDQNKGESSNEGDSPTTKVPNNEDTTINTETKVPTTTENENEVPTTTTTCDTNTDENNKDVEKFGGKIVYNPDGSAYIIEDGNLSEDEACPLPLPKHEGCIVEKTTDNEESNEETPSYPLIANAIYVTRSAAYYNALYGQAYAKILKDKMMPEAPIVHSYKVYSLRQEQQNESGAEPPLVEYSTVPVKPILMCFVCKLSFGFASSFVNHLSGEHNIHPSDKEKSILEAKNSSALIQLVGKDKEPVLSFLEPVVKAGKVVPNPSLAPPAVPVAPAAVTSSVVPSSLATSSSSENKDQILSPNAIKGLLSAALTQQKGGFPGLPGMDGNAAGPSRPAAFPGAGPNLPPFLANAMANSGSLFESLTSAAMLRSSLESLARKSPSENNNGRSSVSPVSTPAASMAPSPLSLPGLLDSMPGTTIGACPEHINGRQTGVECANCDMILNSPRMPGGIAWNAARNSCKTLKCPKCNWHYKYQETLEIHMKEKHPENDSTCIYCITGQQHPRLARGETYTCGYKPYRCEVCNYSTTTKGNLSIHTQSDKHLNNMQELQKGGVVTSPDGTKVSKGPFNPPFGNPLASLVKQKPNWRCDVCNYETNVARNLRIHMTSEKHTHNIMVLQQNVKHMQQQIASGNNPGAPGPVPGPAGLFPGLPDPQQLLQMQLTGAAAGNLGLPGSNQDNKPGQSEAAMADMAYLQALMMQMMTGGQFPPGPLPAEFNLNNQQIPGPSQADHGLNPEAMEPPPEPAEANPKFLFNCCVCKDFHCDNLELVSQHLTLDRSRSRCEDEVSVVIAGNSICKLCNYKTNLKANFQLHCKTDKHLQRLNHVNHIKEGGPNNEWKLKFLNIANPVQLRCNACDYYTNSLHKLQIHVSSQRHEISNILFNHLRKAEVNLENPSYACVLCKFTSSGKLALMGHVRSMKHLQMEQLHQIQKRAEGNAEHTEIGDIFQVMENTSENNEQPADHEASSSSKEKNNESNEEPAATPPTPCPLCQEPYTDYSELENHVMQIHSVNSDGLQRLLVLMEGSHWLNNNRSANNSVRNSDSPTTSTFNAEESENNETTTSSLGTISEKHVYKYRCAQCSLAFKTAEKLALHSQYHVIRDSTKCRLCSRSFRSVQALIKHVESSHSEVPAEELAHYKLGLMNHPLLMAGLSGQVLDSSTNDLLRIESNKNTDTESSEIMDTDNESEDQTSKKSLLNFKTNKSEKGLNYPLEKYLDPNRPYKCDVCKESFTQKNILLVHYNSVSHLHKLKKTMQDQQKSENESKSPPRVSLESALNNMANAKQMRLEDEASDKPYKCNICKVSYNQGSTLDIHIRSVLHQTRASKLQDLALSGQIDFSKPLIEQPDSKALQDQHKKILQDMLSPKSSFNSSSSSQPSPTSSPTSNLLNLQQILLNAKQQQQQQQQQNEEQQAPAPQALLQQFLQTLNNNSNDNTPPSEEQLKTFLAESKKSNQTVKNLLENYGFELVMQFNECHQRQKREAAERKRQQQEQQEKSKNEDQQQTENNQENSNEQKTEQQEINNDPAAEKAGDESNKEEHHPTEDPIPEIIKSKCPACSKEFSSIWVLKAHSEEVHKDVVPQDFLEKYIKELKQNLDKNSEAETSDLDSSPIKKASPAPNSALLTPEKSSEDGERSSSVFPETSTPKSRSPTPNLEAKKSDNLNISDFSSNFQKAMLNAQQQSQGINPMLLQMAQFQGMNPLVAMNLHPPLIPPSILAATQNQNGNLMKANEESAAQLQLMMKLGMDPKLLAQGMPAAGPFNNKLPDPNLLALLSGVNQQQPAPMPDNLPDPKLLFQMMQMGMPGQGPDPKLLLQLMGKDLNAPHGMPAGFDPSGRSGPSSMTSQKPVQFPQPEQTKRARTRITDDQLKVLRSNFDINNSPSEEQIMNMAAQTTLPPKVIKHWFRNTLFKERQKNKDSPYNFNNPPSTMLNLEEYERTGEPKVIALKPEEQQQYTNDNNQHNKINEEAKQKNNIEPVESETEDCKPKPASTPELRVKNNEELIASSSSPTTSVTSETSIAPTLTLSSILSSQMAGQMPKPGSFLPHPLVPNFPPSTTAAMNMAAAGRLPEFLNPLANMMANEPSQRRSPTPQNQAPSSGGGNGGHQGKRANRTRFTDYQIKVLQEFFENNAYPKDDDLEYLSKLLSLSPRVIVVWFQNARQKARKIYENQPPIDPNDDGAGRFTRTPGLNYQCKKCLLVFQRYYELIRHQKQHCFKEEDAKRSAQAQKAAAQAAAQFNSQQLGSSPSAASQYGQQQAVVTSQHSDDSNSSTSHDRTIQSPMFNHNFDKRRSFDGGSADEWGSEQSFNVHQNEDSSASAGKKMTPSMFDQLARNEPAAHAAAAAAAVQAHQGLFPKLTAPSTLFPSYPPSSPFGILQQQALQNPSRDRDSDDFDTESVGSSPSSGAGPTGSSNKRKHSDVDGVDMLMDDKDDSGQPRDKRLRTTILPEQLDYLYQKYQIESNPSRKMLEQIANEVGLRKRVVQVWFQNTRARERKGQFRAHQQVINKRCPFCPAIFRVRSALESHLATKHADHYTRGEIDIDALPDAEGFHTDQPGVVTTESSRPVAVSTPNSMPPLPPLVPTTSDQLHSMQKYYEDTMKRYMNDLQASNNVVTSSANTSDTSHATGLADSNPPTLVGQQS